MEEEGFLMYRGGRISQKKAIYQRENRQTVGLSGSAEGGGAGKGAKISEPSYQMPTNEKFLC